MTSWIQGDVLVTHTGRYEFEGQENGKLCFGSHYRGYKRYWWPIKQVNEMIKSKEWKQYKLVHI